MQDDLSAPDYEYPEHGRRLWHRELKSWVRVRNASEEHQTIGEVPVEVEDTGERKTVHLRDLRPRNTGPQ